MKDLNRKILSPQEELNIVDLAEVERRKLDLGSGPIGEKIFTVFRNINIQLLFFTLTKKDVNGLEAFYLKKYSSITGVSSHYIAINCWVPLDLQIFNSCHEYYHHIDDIHDSIHIKRFGDSDDKIINAKANRFAAEFLLPTESLQKYIKKHNRGEMFIGNWPINSLLRIIIQLQIDYQVPYRMIAKRLNEIKAIDTEALQALLLVDERNQESSYFRIGLTMNQDLFRKLNVSFARNSVDSEALNLILKNYDEELISVDTAIKDLEVFGRTIEDFGYKVEVDESDLDELEELFGDYD